MSAVRFCPVRPSYISDCMKERQPTKGWGPWKQTWFSICSMHYYHDDTCNMCTIGSWYNDYRHFVSSLIFKVAPKFWIWWVNR